MIKTCKLCQTEKSIDDFYSFYDKWSDKKYVGTRCKSCHQQYRRDSATTTQNRKAEKLQLRYGLTFEQWEEMRENENFSCMICGITEDEMDKKLDVDHCHVSGKVRGLLCNPCNNILGHARDNIAILEAAAKYLQENGGGYK
jgi:Recombination endonuclease VII